ncbi:MAG: hypothetical protein AAGG53_02475 [Cyanobacteria bacterium P01_H01_bin.152]
MSRLALLSLLVLPGVAGMAVFGFYTLIDWAELDQAYLEFEKSIQASADLNTLLAQATKQNAHRINVFAEGVWFLLCAIVVAIGIHGLAVRR